MSAQRRVAAGDPQQSRWAGWSTWLVGALVGAVSLWALIADTVYSGNVLWGIRSTGYLLWVVFSLTSAFVLATGRPSWLRLRRGRVSGLWLAALALSSFLIAGVATAMIAGASA